MLITFSFTLMPCKWETKQLKIKSLENKTSLCSMKNIIGISFVARKAVTKLITCSLMLMPYKEETKQLRDEYLQKEIALFWFQSTTQDWCCCQESCNWYWSHVICHACHVSRRQKIEAWKHRREVLFELWRSLKVLLSLSENLWLWLIACSLWLKSIEKGMK